VAPSISASSLVRLVVAFARPPPVTLAFDVALTLASEPVATPTEVEFAVPPPDSFAIAFVVAKPPSYADASETTWAELPPLEEAEP
jgi:hypothetical protein